MKKQLLFILSFGGFVAANAQITVTQADVAPIGSQMFRGTDTSYTESPIGPGGTNMSWDFSGIVDDTGDTISFVDPAGLPDYSQFPSSNLGVTFGNATAYTILNASGLTVIGQAATIQGNSIALEVNPPETFIKFPANYGDAYSDSSVAFSQFPYTAQSGVDSARIKSTKVKQVSIDAWGSLIIPFGTFNVIRQREDIIQYDTVDAHLTGFPPFVPPSWTNVQADMTITTHYTYWANGIGFPVMEADSSDAGDVDVTWLLQTPQIGLKDAVANGKSNVFPNPASDNIFIGLERNTDVVVEVYDLQGKLVNKTETKGIVAQLNVSALEKGLYVYKVNAKDGSFASQGRFVVSR